MSLPTGVQSLRPQTQQHPSPNTISVARSRVESIVLSTATSWRHHSTTKRHELSRFLGDLDLGRLLPKPRSDPSPPQASTSGRILAPEAPSKCTAKQHNQSPVQLSISWAGSGLYFFWQLGALKYLAEHFDLTKVPMAGASGGSIAAVLAACQVPADYAIQRAYELSLQHNIWQEPRSFLGAWGGLVEDWLDEMLPENAHELCRGRITVVVTTLPDCRQVGISDFKDKRDLIDAVMASSHIPLVLDLRMSKRCRGRPCIDGSFPDFFFGNCELLTRGGGAVVFDYFDDTALNRQGRMDMLQLTSFEDLKNRMQLGYAYARRLHLQGAFKAFAHSELLPASSVAVDSALQTEDAKADPEVALLDDLLAQQGSLMGEVHAAAVQVTDAPTQPQQRRLPHQCNSSSGAALA